MVILGAKAAQYPHFRVEIMRQRAMLRSKRWPFGRFVTKSYSLSTRVIFHEKNEEHMFANKPVIFLVQSAETRSIKGDGAWLQNHGQSDLILNNKLTYFP